MRELWYFDWGTSPERAQALEKWIERGKHGGEWEFEGSTPYLDARAAWRRRVNRSTEGN